MIAINGMDIAFGENLVLLANPSKTGNDWWYGTVVRDGKSGFFPQTYVQQLDIGAHTHLFCLSQCLTFC